MIKRSFVIQEHKADKAGLHYDFRLEFKGVYKSWVLPKGLPTAPGKPRLAIQVLDHDLDWGSFSGKIKEGYGKGTVKIWDKGEYETLVRTATEWKFRLKGKRSVGVFQLTRMNPGKWLMRKVKEKGEN